MFNKQINSELPTHVKFFQPLNNNSNNNKQSIKNKQNRYKKFHNERAKDRNSLEIVDNT